MKVKKHRVPYCPICRNVKCIEFKGIYIICNKCHSAFESYVKGSKVYLISLRDNRAFTINKFFKTVKTVELDNEDKRLDEYGV
ncbi:hypothetical protein KEJ27_09860 [Candidatus Bathyarchaeota archaeon]|nr:hypothetical protein [Candidatus Bathyarchaeota archaeon]